MNLVSTSAEAVDLRATASSLARRSVVVLIRNDITSTATATGYRGSKTAIPRVQREGKRQSMASRTPLCATRSFSASA